MRGDFKEVTYGYCKCGCGKRTKLSAYNDKRRGWIKGQPVDFISGHHCRFGKDNHYCKNVLYGKDSPAYGISRFGEKNSNWKGGRVIEKNKNTSYVFIYMPKHPKSNNRGYIREHILVAEKALGKYLSEGVAVHHIDGDGLNNELCNLMVFKNNAEHTKFHTKQRRLNNG